MSWAAKITRAGWLAILEGAKAALFEVEVDPGGWLDDDREVHLGDHERRTRVSGWFDLDADGRVAVEAKRAGRMCVAIVADGGQGDILFWSDVRQVDAGAMLEMDVAR